MVSPYAVNSIIYTENLRPLSRKSSAITPNMGSRRPDDKLVTHTTTSTNVASPSTRATSNTTNKQFRPVSGDATSSTSCSDDEDGDTAPSSVSSGNRSSPSTDQSEDGGILEADYISDRFVCVDWWLCLELTICFVQSFC